MVTSREEIQCNIELDCELRHSHTYGVGGSKEHAVLKRCTCHAPTVNWHDHQDRVRKSRIHATLLSQRENQQIKADVGNNRGDVPQERCWKCQNGSDLLLLFSTVFTPPAD